MQEVAKTAIAQYVSERPQRLLLGLQGNGAGAVPRWLVDARLVDHDAAQRFKRDPPRAKDAVNAEQRERHPSA